MAVYPSLQALRAFEAAARHASMLSAADELHITPGAVSRQIQGLEALLGIALFQRRHRAIALTRAGQEFLDEIRQPLAQLLAATERRREADDGAVAICAHPTSAIRWFIPRWGAFYDRHPGINVRLATSLDPVDFTGGEHDIAIQVLPETLGPGLGGDRLFDIETMPVCAPPLAARLKAPPDLGSMTLLHGEPRPGDWRRWLAFAGVEDVDGSAGLRFESLNLAFQGAIEGLGVAMGVEALIQDDLAAGRLVAPFPDLKRRSRPLGLVYPVTALRKTGVRALRDWLLAEARGAA